MKSSKQKNQQPAKRSVDQIQREAMSVYARIGERSIRIEMLKNEILELNKRAGELGFEMIEAQSSPLGKKRSLHT